MAHPLPPACGHGTPVYTAKKQKAQMAKRTDTKIAILVQVMDELGFDRETIGKVSGVPQRTVSDIINGKGCWTITDQFNEVRELYRLYLRNCILDESLALGHMVLKRFEELSKDADFTTAFSIANAVMSLVSNFDDGR